MSLCPFLTNGKGRGRKGTKIACPFFLRAHSLEYIAFAYLTLAEHGHIQLQECLGNVVFVPGSKNWSLIGEEEGRTDLGGPKAGPGAITIHFLALVFALLIQ